MVRERGGSGCGGKLALSGSGGRREEGLGEVAAVLGAPPVRHLLPECLGRPPVSQHPPCTPQADCRAWPSHSGTILEVLGF